MSLLNELRRRNVLRVGAAYAVTAWLIIQVVETVFPIYGLSNQAIRVVISALAVMAVPLLLFTWAFELTPDGFRWDKDVDRSQSISSDAGKKLDRIIIVVLALALGYFTFDKFVLSESREAEIAESAREAGRTEAFIGTFGERSIAVLPFVDMSPNLDQEYMSDGIAEELLNLLAKIRELRVISRSSAFSFKGKDIDIPSVSRQLNAAYVLEGSVRLAGDQIRITAQLIDGPTDTHRWSNTYDRKLENIFEIQDEIAAAVVDELKLELLGETPRIRSVDEETYKTVLQARYMWNRRAPGDEERVLELYQQAVERSPNYSPAWSGLSVAYAVAAMQERMDSEEGLRLALEAAEKAVALDPDSADAHIRVGQALARQDDYEGWITEFERAFELEPNNPLVLGALARQAAVHGNFEKAMDLHDRAEQVDPLGAIWPTNRARTLMDMGDLEGAEQALGRAFELNGDVPTYNAGMADIYIHRGDFERAVDALREVPAERQWMMRHAIANYGAGNHEASEHMLEKMREIGGPLMPSGMAAVFAVRGDVDTAFEWLEKDTQLTRLSTEHNIFYRNLRDDPRWLPYLVSLDRRLEEASP